MALFAYSSERNVQMIISLLKSYNIKRIIASPGATNVSFVASIQQDSFFEIYSCVDERSAAYMACGLAEETAEPVVISCTGATSSRNYMPGLTEAFYRKIPIIAITSSMENANIGHLRAQVTNRLNPPSDTVYESVQIGKVKDKIDEWDFTIKLNRVINNALQLSIPVHINLATVFSTDYSIKVLPKTKVIRRILHKEDLPDITYGKTAIFVGSHKRFTEEEENVLDFFCEVYNAIVLCDHTSGYYGKYKVMHALIGAQDQLETELFNIDTLIHIGEISGNYDTLRKIHPKQIWRVNPDGEYRDTLKKLSLVVKIDEIAFFNHLTKGKKAKPTTYFDECEKCYKEILNEIPKDLPLSNISIALNLYPKLPANSKVYLGILNTLRSWNYFKTNRNCDITSNVGGFGIDGISSSLIGASFAKKHSLYIAILGDLSFFYDLNSICNRHICNNLRIIVINNGHGQEFVNYNHRAAFMEEDVEKYVAAYGHNGNKSNNLLKYYSENLGFKYLSANNNDDFIKSIDVFLNHNSDKPILLEVFTTKEDENNALRRLRTIVKEPTTTKLINQAKNILKKVIKK